MATDATVRPDLSLVFERFLRDDLGDQYDDVRARNRVESNPNVCHSHDLIDSNMTMLRAFQLVHGREPDAESGADCALMNDAWGAWIERSRLEPAKAVTARIVVTCPECDHESPNLFEIEEATVTPGRVLCWNCGETYTVDEPRYEAAIVALVALLRTQGAINDAQHECLKALGEA